MGKKQKAKKIAKQSSSSLLHLSYAEKEMALSNLMETLCGNMNENKGKGSSWEIMLKNWELVRWGISSRVDTKTNKAAENTKLALLCLAMLPYINDGSRNVKEFDMWYEYVSKFNLHTEQLVLVYRAMSRDEFNQLDTLGNQSPSWSIEFDMMRRFASLQMCCDNQSDIVGVYSIFDGKDVIVQDCKDNFDLSKTDYEPNVNVKTNGLLTDECETFIKKGAKPIISNICFEFGVDWFESFYGVKLDDVKTSRSATQNGFTIFKDNTLNGVEIVNDNNDMFVDFVHKVMNVIIYHSEKMPLLKTIPLLLKLTSGPKGYEYINVWELPKDENGIITIK
jgi:hypothetical protein